MRIGIDGATWTNTRGYGRFTRELVRALTDLDCGHEYTIFLDQFASLEEMPTSVKVCKITTKVAPAQAASAAGYRSPRDLLAFSRALGNPSLDLLFFPSVYTYVPVWRRMPIVVAVHDVIAERYPQYVFASARARVFWNIKTRVALWQARRVLTVSRHSQLGIQDYFHISADRIRLTNEAPSSVFRPIPDRAGIASCSRPSPKA